MFRGFGSTSLKVLLFAAALSSTGPAWAVRLPIFEGVMGKADGLNAIFTAPGTSGSWLGIAGKTIPGTPWVILNVSLRPQATVTLRIKPGQDIVLGLRQAYWPGHGIVSAEELEPPPSPSPSPSPRAPSPSPSPAASPSPQQE
jgi:hypothetical protein